jgi:hypothetical protein
VRACARASVTVDHGYELRKANLAQIVDGVPSNVQGGQGSARLHDTTTRVIAWLVSEGTHMRLSHAP